MSARWKERENVDAWARARPVCAFRCPCLAFCAQHACFGLLPFSLLSLQESLDTNRRPDACRSDWPPATLPDTRILSWFPFQRGLVLIFPTGVIATRIGRHPAKNPTPGLRPGRECRRSGGRTSEQVRIRTIHIPTSSHFGSDRGPSSPLCHNYQPSFPAKLRMR